MSVKVGIKLIRSQIQMCSIRQWHHHTSGKVWPCWLCGITRCCRLLSIFTGFLSKEGLFGILFNLDGGLFCGLLDCLIGGWPRGLIVCRWDGCCESIRTGGGSLEIDPGTSNNIFIKTFTFCDNQNNETLISGHFPEYPNKKIFLKFIPGIESEPPYVTLT